MVKDMQKEQKVPIRFAHDIFKGEIFFAEFVIECLSLDGAVIQKEVRAPGIGRTLSFDCFLDQGFPGLTKEGTFVEIKYTNNMRVIVDFIKTHKQVFESNPVVIVSLVGDVKKESPIISNNVCILGVSFILELIRKHPRQWWVFTASSSKDNNIFYDETKKMIRVSNPPVAASVLGKEIYVDEESPTELSAISEADFKQRLKTLHNPAMIIGNGTSIHFGSDLWSKMSDTLFDYLSPKYVDSIDLVKKSIGDSTYSSTSMSRFMVESKKYDQALYSSVYRKYEDNMHVEGTLVRSIVRVKNSFPEIPLLTYNYDDFLEIDYQKCTGARMRSAASKRSYDLLPEPKVLHVHGWIPFKRPSSRTKVVLTQEDYFKAYKGHSGIVQAQREVLRNNTCLFVGSSMSDIYQMSMINEINTRYYSVERPYSWRCFALLCLKGLTPKDIVAVYNYYLSKGVSIIFTMDFDELPKKLLDLFK